MTVRTCPTCGTPERRGVDDKGRATVNLESSTGLCLDCLVKAAADGRTFHSRREDRKGEAIDVKSLASRNDE